MGKKQRPGAEAPYRAGGAHAAGPADEGGLVSEVVRQFADPYSFYRELVQNSIDAGATKIAVRVVHDAADRSVKIAVQDDGSGMTEAILTEDLTVLFKSTKEARDDAIGKFGIGFVSVLAIGPTLVTVDTSTGDGVRHRLELFPDHTWELLRSQGSGRGTTVSLTVPVDDLTTLLERSRASLGRWCRHATIPITFVAHGDGLGLDAEPVRIDGPLSLEGTLIQVAGRSKDGRTELIVGLPRGAPSAAFFNRGLLLYEASHSFPRLPGVSFKVMDGRLEHTLSRDDVRRDAHFAEVLERVERTVRGPLTDLAHEVSQGLPLDEFRALHAAAMRADLELRADRLEVPLSHPVAGRKSLALARFEVLRTRPCHPELAEALATQGLPVAAFDPSPDSLALADLARRAGLAAVPAGDHDTLVRPGDAGQLAALIEPLVALLGRVLRRPSAVAFVRLLGRAQSVLTLGADIPERPVLLAPGELKADPFRLLRRPPLLISLDHQVSRAALRALGRGADPKVVAAVLARAILVERHAHGALAGLTEAAVHLVTEPT